MPHDPHLAERMRRALSKQNGISEKKMFGGFCWMLNGNMLCGVEVGRFMFRVGKVQEAEALSRPGASPMDITGRPMRGFVWVRQEHAGAPVRRWRTGSCEADARYCSGSRRSNRCGCNRHDVIVLDQQVPGMNGSDVMKACSGHCPGDFAEVPGPTLARAKVCIAAGMRVG